MSCHLLMANQGTRSLCSGQSLRTRLPAILILGDDPRTVRFRENSSLLSLAPFLTDISVPNTNWGLAAILHPNFPPPGWFRLSSSQ